EEARRRAASMIEDLHLGALKDKNPFHLSAGEKRRAALAGVLVMEPEGLILDEPTTFLDPPGGRDLSALLNRLAMTKLVITHDARFARETCEEAAFFESGRITARGPTEEILRRFDWS